MNMRFMVFFVGIALCGVQCAPKQEEESSIIREKRSDDISPLETVVQTLSQQVAQNNAKISALEARLGKEETNVAFHVEFSTDPVALGPNAPLIFDRVKTNVGNGYEVITGNFQAPVSGTYMFVVNYMGAITTYLYVHILVDNVIVDYSISHGDSTTWDHVSENIVIQLKAGQRVHLKNGSNVSKSIRGNHWSTFSGFLIKADP